MSYKHELKSLEYKLKRAEQRRDDALDGENEVDIEIAENYVEEIEHRISVYEKAQKHDEKARKYDELKHTYEQYKESHTHDLKSTMGTKAIELLEADE